MAIHFKDGRIEFEGAVLGTITRDERVMSDIYAFVHYASVWDAVAGKVREVRYATDFELSTNNGWAEVDATDEVRAMAAAWAEGRAAGWAMAAAFAKAEQAEREAAKAAAVAAKRAEVEANAPKVGDSVEAKRDGRGCPKGTKGVVFWTGWSKRHDASWRVGFKDAAGATYWMPATGVKVVERASATPASDLPSLMIAGEAWTPVANHVAKGDRVTIAAGKADGVVGRIIWVGADKFSGAARVGVRDSRGETYWVSADQVRAA